MRKLLEIGDVFVAIRYSNLSCLISFTLLPSATTAPALTAARASPVQTSGVTVPSPGLYRVPYTSSTFRRGYSAWDS